MEDAAWLKTMLASELEVRPPRSLQSEGKALERWCSKIHIEGRLVAFAEMRKVGSHVEISTVLVDKNHRGMGVGGLLIEDALEHIPDGKVLCCTKNPAMAAVLQKQGFSPIGWPGTKTAVSLSVNTVRRLASMLFRLEFRRVWIQGKGILKYERYELRRT
jgi:GNAT superfamily N-acetyltransferase